MDRKDCRHQVLLVDRVIELVRTYADQPDRVEAVYLQEAIERLLELRETVTDGGNRSTNWLAKIDVVRLLELLAKIVMGVLGDECK